MGTVRERIAIAPVRRVADVGQAFGAGGGVGDDAGCDGAAPAFHDAEIRWRFARQRCRFDQVDPGEGRGLRRERDFERDDDRRMPESANEHTLAVVPDVASQAEVFRETPHRRAEAYALHETTHPDGYSFDLVYCVQPRPPNAPCDQLGAGHPDDCRPGMRLAHIRGRSQIEAPIAIPDTTQASFRDDKTAHSTLMHRANHAWIEGSYNMLDRNGRRFTFLYGSADKGLLASAGHTSRVARRKIPGCRRDDLIVEDAPLADLQPMVEVAFSTSKSSTRMRSRASTLRTSSSMTRTEGRALKRPSLGDKRLYGACINRSVATGHPEASQPCGFRRTGYASGRKRRRRRRPLR